MAIQYDVIVTKKRFLKKSIELKGKILNEYFTRYADWMGMDFEEKHTIIELESGETIEIIDDQSSIFTEYSYVKI